MGPCSSRRRNLLSSDDSEQPYYLTLIENIFVQAQLSQQYLHGDEKYLDIRRKISPDVKQLIEYLENNQIRLNDTLQQLQQRIRNGKDIIFMHTVLIVLESIIEAINKLLQTQSQSSKSLDDEEEQDLLQQQPSIDHQRRLHHLMCFSTICESKSELLHLYFSYLIQVLQRFSTSLLQIHYDQQMKIIVQLLQDIIFKYLLPIIYDNDLPQDSFDNKNHRQTVFNSFYQQEKVRNQNIEKLITSLKEEVFIDTFSVYIAFLRVVDSQRSELKGSNQLFRSETQKTIVQSLLWLYAKDKFNLNPQANLNTIFARMGQFLIDLIGIYLEKALILKLYDEFFETVFLNFNLYLWCNQTKVEKVFLLILNGPGKGQDKQFELFILNLLLDQIQFKQVYMMQVQSDSSDQFQQPAKIIKEMQTKQFSHYLTETDDGPQSGEIRQQVQNGNKSRSKNVYPTKHVIAIKTASRCLQLLIIDIKSTEFLFFQSERAINTILKTLILAYQVNYQDLYLQLKVTLDTLVSLYKYDLNNFVNILYQMVIFSQQLLNGDKSNQLSRKLSVTHLEEVVDDHNHIDDSASKSSLILDLIIEIIEQVDQTNQYCLVEDELIFSLFTISEFESFELKQKVLCIISHLIAKLDIVVDNSSLSQSSLLNYQHTESNFVLSDNSISLYLMKCYKIECSNIQMRNSVNNSAVYQMLQVTHYLVNYSSKQSEDMIYQFALLMKAQLDQRFETNKKKDTFCLLLFSVISLLLIEKYQLAIPQCISQLLGTQEFSSLRKSHINDILNFSFESKLQQKQIILKESNKYLEQINRPSDWNFEVTNQHYEEKLNNLRRKGNYNIVQEFQDVEIMNSVRSKQSQQSFNTIQSQMRNIDPANFEDLLAQSSKTHQKQQNLILADKYQIPVTFQNKKRL